MKNTKTILLIAGMHRSGTSFVANTLRAHGVDLGLRANWRGEDNPLGFGEDRLMVQCNEALLHQAGTTWDRPVIIDRDLEQEGLQTDRLLADKAGEIVAFKDPRFCWTYPTWHRIWPEAKLIAVIRHPAEVAKSLMKRNPLSWDEALAMWYQAYTNLDRWDAPHWISYPTCIGMEFLDSFGIHLTQEILDHMYRGDMRHQVATEEENEAIRLDAPEVYELYNNLTRYWPILSKEI